MPPQYAPQVAAAGWARSQKPTPALSGRNLVVTLYYHPDRNAVLIVDSTPDTVWLYGLLAEDLPPMAEIIPALDLTSQSWVVTNFSPDLNAYG